MRQRCTSFHCTARHAFASLSSKNMTNTMDSKCCWSLLVLIFLAEFYMQLALTNHF